jgi:DUF917 family protein
VRILTLEDVKDVLAGFAVLGSGGGGSAAAALERLEQTDRDGYEFRLATLDELDATARLACIGGIGAQAVTEDAAYDRLPRAQKPAGLLAIEALAAYEGVSLDALMTAEIGVEALSDAWCPAAELGLPLVDADAIGRAVPEVQHSLFNLHNVPITPQAVATEVGDTLIITNVACDERSEALLRAMAMASGDLVYALDHPGTVAELRPALIPGVISLTQRIGRALRATAAEGGDTAAAAATAGGGGVRFRGAVAAAHTANRGGFTCGETLLTGNGHDFGSEYRIWLKNENLMSWRNGDVDVTTPDVITLIGDKGDVLLNPCGEAVGRSVAVVAVPAPAQLRTAEAIALLGPQAFGFDVRYRPTDGRGRTGEA